MSELWLSVEMWVGLYFLALHAVLIVRGRDKLRAAHYLISTIDRDFTATFGGGAISWAEKRALEGMGQRAQQIQQPCVVQLQQYQRTLTAEQTVQPAYICLFDVLLPLNLKSLLVLSGVNEFAPLSSWLPLIATIAIVVALVLRAIYSNKMRYIRNRMATTTEGLEHVAEKLKGRAITLSI
jgi:hypothetical protein